MDRHYPLTGSLTILCCMLFSASVVFGQAPNIQRAKQGYSMRLCFDNSGAFGHVVYSPRGGTTPPDSLGLEYPIGQPYEHIYGGGIWIGGKVDTSRTGTSTPIPLVTAAYEGYGGGINALFQFNPGSSQADTIWKVTGRGVPRPQGWETYWGNLIPALSVSDNDHYCLYDDASFSVLNHIPLRVKVSQNSFIWDDPYAEAIHIIEYRIVNIGFKSIDSAYIAMFMDADVGPIGLPTYYTHNWAGYYPPERTAYITNQVDYGSTPVGVALLAASRPLDSLRLAFQWYPLANSPITAAAKYAVMSSGIIRPDEYPSISDSRFLLSCGPFTLRPGTNPTPDTLLITFAIVSGQNVNAMLLHADRAQAIYLNGGQVGVNGPGHEAPSRFELLQNYPNPFNPTTTIRFALPRAGHVRVSVMNMLGEEVAVLVNQTMQIGTHSVVWSAGGSSSGVYFYRIRTDQFVETRKLILLR